MTQCPNCQHELKGHEKFCPKCGQKIEGVQGTTKVSQPVPVGVNQLTQPSRGIQAPSFIQANKKWLLSLLAVFAIAFLGFNFWKGQQKTDISPYITFTYTGLSGSGEMYPKLDFIGLKDALIKSGRFNENNEAQSMVFNLDQNLSYKIDSDSGLKNGQEVKVTFTFPEYLMEEKGLIAKDKKIKVEGLEEPKVLTNDMVEGHVVANFSGISGQGQAKLVSILPDELRNVSFDVENNGALKNGDKVKLKVDDNSLFFLENAKYIIADDFGPMIEVSGLERVADSADQIVNLADVKRMIQEEVDRRIVDTSTYLYNTKLEKILYRSLANGETNFSHPKDPGSLMAIYSVERYLNNDERQLDRKDTFILGFTDLMLDDTNKVNVANMTLYKETYNDSYSLESLIQLLQGVGYTIVE